MTYSVSARVALTLAHTVTNMAGTPEGQSTTLMTHACKLGTSISWHANISSLLKIQDNKTHFSPDAVCLMMTDVCGDLAIQHPHCMRCATQLLHTVCTMQEL